MTTFNCCRRSLCFRAGGEDVRAGGRLEVRAGVDGWRMESVGDGWEAVNGPAVSKFAKIAENGYAFY